ncbi:MAG: hypothetical protein M0P94_04315 [Candidatus Absconditabacterales bacterium]|nr:hypothetical protein [Candidatus Absconditabacterales bacterium]
MTIFVSTLIGNIVIGVILVALIFVLRFFKKQLIKYIDYFTAITVGVLLGVVFLGFLPEIIESGLHGFEIGIYILIGLFVFYILELILHYHHCKDLVNKEDHHHKHENQTLIFAGTFLHNIMHGVVLFSAFAISTEFGIATTIAVLLHSIPQNTANYIMNHKKESFVIIAALGGIIGAIILFPFKEFLLTNKFIIIAMMAGALSYLALTDILPEVKNKGGIKIKLLYLLFILLGLLFVFLLNYGH